jgi:hypothetical protein
MGESAESTTTATEATGTGGASADTGAPPSDGPTGPGPTSDATSEAATSAATTNGPTDVTGDPTGADTDTDTDGDSDTEQPVIDCDATPLDHAAACPEPCPLTVDLEIRCGGRLGDVAVSVAPAPDTTWLVADTFEASLLFRADALDAVRLDVLPNRLAARAVHAALDPAGKLHLLGDTSDTSFKDGALTHFAESADWQPSEIFSVPGKEMYPIGFEVDADGKPHAWFTFEANKQQEAVADGQGGWIISAVPKLGTHQQRESLTADGRRVIAAFDLAQALFDIDGVVREIGDPIDTDIPGGSSSLRIAAAPAPGDLMIDPPTAVAIHDEDDGLKVAWPKQADGHVNVDLPDTAAPVVTCFATSNGPGTCPKEPCIEKSSGVEHQAFALARTVDGTLWVAYVITHADRVIDFLEDCRDTCECVRVITTDKTRGELRLFRLKTDGTPPQQVLALPMAALSYPYAGQAVDLRGFGDQLAFGARVGGAEDDPRVHLLRVDTTKIAP